MRAILTAIEGAELKTRLQQITDATWRAEHPERAETLGGHGGPPLHQRLADALMKLVHGNIGGTFGKPTVIVVVDAETLEANITGTGPGSGPVPLVDVADMSDRSDLYTAIRSTKNGILNFGRSRRLASPLQRLAVTVRDHGRCAYPGCDTSHERCQVHHINDFDHGGQTNLTDLALLCSAHHSHLHTNQLQLVRNHNHEWAVVAEQQLQDTG